MAFPPLIDAVEFRREHYGITKKQWAKIIGTSPSHYSEFTKGRRNLTLAQAGRCFEFGVPPECLFQCHNDKDYRDIEVILKGGGQ